MSGEHETALEGDEGRYDSELPFLHALERDVRRHARHAAAARQRAHSMRAERTTADQSSSHFKGDPKDDRHTRRRRVSPAGGRVARRSLALLALLSLVGASAFGAGRLLAGSGAPDPASVRQSAFATLATGAVGDERWSLRAYSRGSEQCRVLEVGDTESSRCSAALGRHSLSADSALSPSGRFLFGLAGATIRSISVRADGGSARTIRARTRALSRNAARATGMGGDERWYVAILARPIGEPDPPLRIQGLDRRGRPTGATLLNCPETGEPSRCSR
ncbi:MAG TPA: hypothetical protein VFR48_01770 [Solirubrobacteraceae bacterium]|nr:hypothetical protein [Solirubrobacteraceae bacterium]